MKALLFWIFGIIGVSWWVILCSKGRFFIYAAFFVMIASLVEPDLSITFFSHELYTAATRGFEVHVADLMALILFITVLRRHQDFPPIPIPKLFFPQVSLIIAAILSWALLERSSFGNPVVSRFGIDVPVFKVWLYPAFEIHKMLRVLFIFWVSAQLLQDKGMRKVLVLASAIMLLYFSLGGLGNRYIHHVYRASINPFHPNVFNTMVGMLGIFLLPYVYASRSLGKSLIYLLLMLLCLVAIILTVSRSSLAGFLFGGFVVTCLCLARFLTLKNLLIVLLASVLSLALIGKALNTLLERFSIEQIVADQAGRNSINAVAINMASDHIFFGVGPGNYYANSLEKYSWTVTHPDVEAIAHNAWLLTFAELGLVGLILFIFLWLRFFLLSCKNTIHSYRFPDPELYASSVGLVGVVIISQFQNFYHYSFRQTSVAFFIAIMMGLAAAIDARGFATRKEEFL